MLQSKTTWKFEEQKDIQSPFTIKGKELSPITMQLLTQRGITSEEEMVQFIHPTLDELGDASMLSMMEKAVERIHSAIADEEKILIFGDYDADGVTSTALLMKALEQVGANCSYYIPNRFTEGYGPNEAAFQQAIDEGVRVIITVDCGINAVQEVKVAQSQGVDVIITDHHDLQEELPEACAIIHPQLSDHYTCKDLAGVGVAFQFATEILQELPTHLLEFVAIGTIADLVPLRSDNRILVHHGLQQLNRTQNIGLQMLMKTCQLHGEITADEIGFSLGPRINAVGRLQNASLAVQLLLATDPNEAELIAEEIEVLNDERKAIVDAIVSEAVESIPSGEHDVLFVAKEGWNEGVLGIVASHLVRMYDRPAIVLSINHEKGVMKGSARSIPAFHMFENCMKIKDLFQAFGGHSQAAGMTIALDQSSKVSEQLSSFFRAEVLPEEMKQVTTVQSTLEIDTLNEQMIKEIDLLAPFGMGNPKPLFNVQAVPTDVRQLGAMKNHLKMQMVQNGVPLDCIAFQMGAAYWNIAPQSEVSIVGELGINEWNGNRTIQIRVEDLMVSEWQLFDYRGKQTSRIEQTFAPDRNEMILRKTHTNKVDDRPNTQYITYNEPIENGHACDALYIMELPNEEEELSRIVQHVQPENIYLCVHVENSTYFSTYTSREDFKWVYGLLKKNSPIDMQPFAEALMRRKKWTKDRLKFIFNVFLELEFVTIKSGVIRINPAPKNRDLTEAATFAARIQKEKIERNFYYSNYSELRSWFSSYLHEDHQVEEESGNEFERSY